MKVRLYRLCFSPHANRSKRDDGLSRAQLAWIEHMPGRPSIVRTPWLATTTCSQRVVAQLPKDVAQKIRDNGGLLGLDIDELGLNDDEAINKLKYQQKVLEDIMSRVKESAGATDPNMAFMFETQGAAMASFARNTGAAIWDYDTAMEKFYESTMQMGAAIDNLSPEMKEMMLNTFRAAAG